MFDVIPLAHFEDGGSRRTARQRRKDLEGVSEFLPTLGEPGSECPIRVIPSYQVNSVQEIMAIYNSIRKRGGEGVIVKDPDAQYLCKRSRGWLKIKAQESEDLRVIGAFEGTGKYEGMLGGLIVDRDGVQVRVGGGFSDQQRQEFWDAWLSDEEMAMSSPDWREETGQLLNRMIEVEYHEVTPDGSLRHPRFVRFRDSLTGVME